MKVCRQHVDEQHLIEQVDAALADFNLNLERLAHAKHPDAPKDLSESALRTLMSRFLPDPWRLTVGYYGPDGTRQADAVLGTDPSYEAQFYGPDDAMEVLVEITHSFSAKRSPSSLRNKLKQDLDKLDAAIMQARQGGTKCWTGQVLLGPNWQGRRDLVGELLHERYHQKDLRPYRAESVGDTLPFPDVIVLPDGMFKKHNYFVDMNEHSKAYAAFAWMPRAPVRLDNFEYRPVLIATVFMLHYLMGLQQPERFKAPAAPEAAYSSVAGPRQLLSSDDPVILLEHPDQRVLHHALDGTKRNWCRIIVGAEERCSLGRLWRATYPKTDALWDYGLRGLA